jgi:hypothetical protein
MLAAWQLKKGLALFGSVSKKVSPWNDTQIHSHKKWIGKGKKFRFVCCMSSSNKTAHSEKTTCRTEESRLYYILYIILFCLFVSVEVHCYNIMFKLVPRGCCLGRMKDSHAQKISRNLQLLTLPIHTFLFYLCLWRTRENVDAISIF